MIQDALGHTSIRRDVEESCEPTTPAGKDSPVETERGNCEKGSGLRVNSAESMRENQDYLSTDPHRPRFAFLVLVGSQFAGTSLWFAPNAILSGVPGFGNDEIATLTSMVQGGFIAGTLLSAYFLLADRLFAPSLFAVSCLLGAVLNFLCVLSNAFLVWAVLRFLVGMCLSGIYPVGMKIAAKLYPEGLGARLGALVGALTLGTAFPWFVRSIGVNSLTPAVVLAVVSCLAAFGGLLLVVTLRPKRTPGNKLHVWIFTANSEGNGVGLVLTRNSMNSILSSPGFRTALVGYCGQ